MAIKVSNITVIDDNRVGLFTGVDSTGVVDIQNSTGAISTTSGALTVAGGVGIGENLFVGQTIYASGLEIAAGDVTANSFSTGNILIETNFIATTISNSNLELRTSGTGTIELEANTNVTGNLDVSVQATLASANIEDLTAGRVVLAGAGGELEDSANLTFDGTTLSVTGDVDVTGDIRLGGNIRIGDQDVDTVTVIADFTSSLIPNDAFTYNLGSSSKPWNTLYVDRIDFDQISIRDNLITTIQSNADLQLDAAGTGTIELLTNTNVNGTLGVTSTANIGTDSNGNILLLGSGDARIQFVVNAADSIIQTAISGDLILTTRGQITDGIKITSASANVIVQTTTNATSSNTGSLQVAGGAGIAKDLYVGGTVYASGLEIAAGDVTANSFSTGNILIDDNFITTTLSNSNLQLDAAGTGKISLLTDTELTGTLTVNPGGTALYVNSNAITRANADFYLQAGSSGFVADRSYVQLLNNAGVRIYGGNTGASGDIVLDGGASEVFVFKSTQSTSISTGALKIEGGLGVKRNVNIGENLSVIGNFDLTGLVTSDLTPDTAFGYSLGSAVNPWNTLYADRVDLEQISIRDNLITTTQSNSNLELDAAGTGRISLLTDTDITGTLTISENVYLYGNTTAPKILSLSPNTTALDISEQDVIIQLGNPVSGNAPSNSEIQFANWSGSPGGLGYIRFNNGGSETGLELNTGFGDIYLRTGYVTALKVAESTQQITIPTNIESTSTTTGSLVVTGGVGITKDLYVGGTIYSGALSVAAGDVTANSFSTGNILIDDNFITTTLSNSNLQLDAAGTGKISLLTDTELTGTLTVSSGITGDIQGSVFGDDSTLLIDAINNAIPAQNITGLGDITNSTVNGATGVATLIYPDDSTADISLGELFRERPSFELIRTFVNPNPTGTDYFGGAVAIDGDRAIVGAQGVDDSTTLNNSGKAFIFNVITGELLHILDNPNDFETSANDQFGASVDISGNFAIVGAPAEKDTGVFLSGRAYIFNVTTGALLHTLSNPNAFGTKDADEFGFSVAIDGDRAIVGAQQEDDAGGLQSGKAYIFNVVTGSLIHTLNNPNASGTSANDLFGKSVDISGNRAIVGASGDTLGGSAYIFDVTSGSLLYSIKSPNTDLVGQLFGWAVAIDEDRAVISSPNADRAYIFDLTNRTLLHTLINNPNGIPGFDYFGGSVDISGDRAIVGARGADDSTNGQSGKACIYDVKTGALLYTINNPNSVGTSSDDYFGESVSISNNRVLIGALFEDTPASTSSTIPGLQGVYTADALLTTNTVISGAETACSIETYAGNIVEINPVTYDQPNQTGYTEVVALNAGDDDNFYEITPPWDNVNFLGTSYNDVFYGSNGYITFGAGSTIYSGLGPNSPNAPKIFVFGQDNICNGLWTGTSGTAPNRIYHVIINSEFDAYNNLGPSIPVRFEIRFYENQQNRIDIHLEQYSSASASSSDDNGTAYVYEIDIPPTIVYTLGFLREGDKFDVIGSVFADDSTLLVDGINSKIVGPVDTPFLRTSESEIALGLEAGFTNQGSFATAVGAFAGQDGQGTEATAIGTSAGGSNQGSRAVSIGASAGLFDQESQSVAIGYEAAKVEQDQNAVAIGTFAGKTTQGIFSVAIGNSAAETNQGESSVAIGAFSGQTNQGDYSVGVGEAAGFTGQADYAVALGFQAGRSNQGLNSIAIGRNAGFLNQAASSIILNASGSTLNASVSGFFVNPIRNASADGVLQYNTATKEIVNSNTITVESLSSGQILIQDNFIKTTESNANLQLDAAGSGSIELLSNTNVTGTLDVSVQATLASANIEDLTAGRVVLAGTSGELQDSANLTFNGTLLTTVDISAKNVDVENVTFDSLSNGNLSVSGNSIRTTQSNTNIELDTAGTGTVELLANTNVTGNLNVSGNVDVTGDITLGGNIRVGDTTLDTVTVVADFTSNLIPNDAFTYNLGSAAKPWNVVYADEFNADQISIKDNTITTTQSNSNLELDAAGTGIIELLSDTSIIGDLTVTGDATITGTLTVDSIDVTNFNLETLGVTELNLERLTVGQMLLDGNFIRTIESNADLDIDAAGTGEINLLTTTNVTGNLNVSGNVDVVGDITLGGNIRIGDTTLDSITVVADFTSNLIPNDAFTYDLGSSSKPWNVVYADEFNADQLRIKDNRISSTQSNANIEIDAAGTGIIDLQSNTNVTGTLDVSSQATFSSANVEDLTAGRVVLAGALGELQDSSNLTFNGTVLTTVDVSAKNIDVENITFDSLSNGNLAVSGNSIRTTQSNTNIELDTAGTGTIELIANTNVTGNLDVSVQATLASANVEDLTAGRVVLAGALGELQDSTNLTFNGSLLTTVNINAKNIDIENVTFDSLSNGNLAISGNSIRTTQSNTDIELDTAGTGSIELLADTNVTGNLNVSGNVGVIGDITLGGNIRIGDTTLDSITVVADFTSDLVPNEAFVYNLGSVTKPWKILYADELDLDQLKIKDNTITTTQSNANIEINPAGTGTIELLSNTNVTGTLDVSVQANLASAAVEDLTAGRVVLAGALGELEDSANLTFNGTTLTVTGDLDVTGDIFLGGDIRIGDTTLDTVTVVADFTSNLVPNDNNVYNLGADSKRWGRVFGGAFDTENISIEGGKIATKQSNSNLQLDAAGTGIIEILNSASVTGDLNVTGTLNAQSLIIDDFNFTGLTVESLSTGDIQIKDNFITTTLSNSDLELDAAGTGTIELLTDTNITGALDVSSQATFSSANVEDLTAGRVVLAGTLGELQDSGNLTFDGTELTVSGSISTDSITTNTLIIGDNSITEAGLTIGENTLDTEKLTLRNIEINGSNDNFSVIRTLSSNTDLNIDAAGTGTINLLTDTEITGNLNVSGNIDVVGDITLGGDIRIGDTTLDTVTVVADFTSDLVPNDNNVYNLGSDSKRWGTVYGGSFDTENVSIEGGRIATKQSNSNLQLDAAGTGSIELLNNASVTGDLNVTGTISAQSLTITDFNFTGLTVESISTGDILIKDNTITTTLSNSDLELDAAGTGTINFLAPTEGLVGSDIQLGTATLGDLTTDAGNFTSTTTITDSVAVLNQILGRLVPNPPPVFPGGQTLSIQGTANYRMADFTQTDNTATGSKSVAGGTTVSVLRTSGYQTNYITSVGPGNSGTVAVFENNQSNVTDQRTMTATQNATTLIGDDNGTFGNLQIANDQDYALISTDILRAPDFWQSFDARAVGTVSAGWNEVYIIHSEGSATNIPFWYYDSSAPGTPQFTVADIQPPETPTLSYSSTVPHYTDSNQFSITFNINRLSGDTYPTSDTFVTGVAGGAFSAPASLTYASAGITTPLARNLYVASGNVAISTTAAIRSGFGSSAVGPTVQVTNGYATGSNVFNTGFTVLYKTGTGTQIEETSIPVTDVGSGTGNAFRIANPDNGVITDTPIVTLPTGGFISQTSTLQITDATVVAAVLRHDTNNYSVGYLPPGPDLSVGRSGAQYFTFKFNRTTVSKFDIRYSGTIAGLWIALPGSVIDNTSTLNGWLNAGAAYAGAGVPGAAAGGNGSNGCAIGGVAALNSLQTNRRVTVTFGTVSSSSTGSNEILVRVRLNSGQSVTAIDILTATN